MEEAGTGRQPEESLPSECDERFHAIFSQAAVGIAQLGLDGKWLLVNNRFCEMLGYSEGELLSKTWQDITHPDDLDEVSASRRRLLNGEISSHTMEKRYVRKDGTIMWARLHRSLVRGHENLPKYVVAVVEDITEKVAAERALRESERRLTLAEDAAHLFVWEQDLRSGLIHSSGEHAQLYGFSPDDPALQYHDWLKLVHPQDREQVQSAVAEAVGRTNILHIEFRVVWPDGSLRWLESKGAVILDDSGQASRLVGVTIDITDRKQAEATLYENTMQYKEVFDNISICVFVLDITPEGRFKIAAFNPAEEELVGLSNAQVSGRFIEDLFPEDLAHELIANYRRCLENGRTIKFDHQMTLPNQKPRYFHSNLIPLRNAAGVIHRMIGACVETTDFKWAQKEAVAKQHLETLGVLAGGIAHDFNNVLGGIHAQAELIETDLPTASAALREIQQIKVAATRGAEIVRELMVYAGQDQSRFDGMVDTSQLIVEMLGLLKVSISKHAVLRTDLAEDLPAISGNAPQVRQIIMNLVVNASEAIGQTDGVITISTAHVRSGWDLGPEGPTDLPQGEYVRLDVSDTGSGIPEEARGKIFDPFFTTKFAGRGMGLAVVQRIVHDHSGTVRVASSLGQGTTFQVFLPCSMKRTEHIQEPTIRGGDQASHRKRTVLVVDDEELLRGAVSKLLRRFGFIVLEARDGTEAMALLQRHKEQLEAVLLDVTIPGTSSTEILVAARGIRPDMRIVFTSAYSKEVVEATFGQRVDHFVRKPFRLVELTHLLLEPFSS
ncbi:MAG TPA: PAS domain S-box protein [Bryobacteraceae bacterium]|nr:PAS domain S-box protein [Bryobacteraceae bacterium]